MAPHDNTPYTAAIDGVTCLCIPRRCRTQCNFQLIVSTVQVEVSIYLAERRGIPNGVVYSVPLCNVYCVPVVTNINVYCTTFFLPRAGLMLIADPWRVSWRSERRHWLMLLQGEMKLLFVTADRTNRAVADVLREGAGGGMCTRCDTHMLCMNSVQNRVQ